MKKIFIIVCKTFVRILIALVALIVLAWIGLNISKFFIYKDFYSVLTKVSKNPGLNDGYVPQGTTFFDGCYYTAGYMPDNTASRIYKIDPKTKKSVFVKLTSNGNDFTGHTGGLQYFDGDFYLANESDGLYKFSAELLKNAKKGDFVEIGSPINVNSNTSFVFADDNYLYVGEFNFDVYVCENPFTHNGVQNKAIVEKFNKNDLSKPVAVYSIPDKVQGFCVTDKGTIVLSTSWGLNSSEILVYKTEDIAKTDSTMFGAPVFFLGEPTQIIVAPPMSEDFDIVDGKVVTMFESASNKYFFGKPFFAYYMAGLDID